MFVQFFYFRRVSAYFICFLVVLRSVKRRRTNNSNTILLFFFHFIQFFVCQFKTDFKLIISNKQQFFRFIFCFHHRTKKVRLLHTLLKRYDGAKFSKRAIVIENGIQMWIKSLLLSDSTNHKSCFRWIFWWCQSLCYMNRHKIHGKWN